MKHHFLKVEDKLSLSAPRPIKRANEEDNHHYLMPFDDHPEEDGILTNPRSIMKMRVEKGELPWADLRIQIQNLSNQLFNTWCQKVLGFFEGW